MSSSLSSVELSNADCERGQVSQQPPILYVQSKSSTTLIASRETIKMKTPEGESKQAVLGNGAYGEECLKHLKAFFRYAEKLGHDAKLESAEKPPKLRTESSRRSEEKNLRTTKVLLQKPRDLRKSRLRKKILRKPRLPRAPSRACQHMISFVNCYETTQKPNGIESCPICTRKILGRI